MLHITSFMQSLAKLNNNNKIGSDRETYLKALSRNYSFVYDTYSNRVDYMYGEESGQEQEQRGYWGYMRDTKADQKMSENSMRRRRSSSKTTTSPSVLHASSSSSLDDNISSSSSSPSSGPPINVNTDDVFTVKDECDFDRSESLSAATRKLVYDYKRSQFKIEAGKRDQMKMLIQELHEEEEKMRKETLKLLRDPTTTSDPNDLKVVRLLYFSNNNESTKNNESTAAILRVLSKLNKPIVMYNNTSQPFNVDHLVPFVSSVHLAVGLTNSTTRSSTISLCSNLELPGCANLHSTILYEHNGVKIGFVALFDEQFCSSKLKNKFPDLVYKDFVSEANRLSDQMRACGASLVVALTNFDDVHNESRLRTECASSINLVISSSSPSSSSSLNGNSDLFRAHPHTLKFETANSFDYVYILTLRIDMTSAPRIVHIDLDKYAT